MLMDYIDEYDDMLAEVYDMAVRMTEGLKASEVNNVRRRLFKWIGRHYDTDDAYDLMDSACEQLEAIKKDKRILNSKKKVKNG